MRTIARDKSSESHATVIAHLEDEARAEAVSVNEPQLLAEKSHVTNTNGMGWDLDPTERRDFFHRLRVLPREIGGWRKQLTSRFLRDSYLRRRFGENSLQLVRGLVDRNIILIREIARILNLVQAGSNASDLPAAPHKPNSCLSEPALRVFIRLGPFKEFNTQTMVQSEPRVASYELIPPSLRTSLSRTLEVHGNYVCLKDKPQCQNCDIRMFCESYRRTCAQNITCVSKPEVVDLFCGAGGMSEGFKRAGFKVILALDKDPASMKTYSLNHPDLRDEQLLCRDISKLTSKDLRKLVGRRRLDVLVGGPPCQGFSQVGSRSKRRLFGYRASADARNFLFEHMVEAALELRPKLFLMENVPGMESAKHGGASFLETAQKMLEREGGFRTSVWRLNASAFGVPQDRVRYFLVGSALSLLPSQPEEEYMDSLNPVSDLAGLPPNTLMEAIFDLPAREAGEGNAINLWKHGDLAEPTYRRYLKKFDLLRPSRLVYNHTARYNNDRDLELYALLRPGEDSVHALERYGRHDLMRYRRDIFDDKYAKLRPDRPSKTIVSHLSKDGNGYIHPFQVRSITIREGARLQSFHDGYVFCGAPRDQWIQIGNAVPPILAEAIARSFHRVLKHTENI